MAAPQQTEQRLGALRAANDTRSARAALKGGLRRGERQVADVLQHPPDYALNMEVADLLRAVPRLGRSKVSQVLRRCDIGASKTIGSLSPRQLTALLTSAECGDSQGSGRASA